MFPHHFFNFFSLILACNVHSSGKLRHKFATRELSDSLEVDRFRNNLGLDEFIFKTTYHPVNVQDCGGRVHMMFRGNRARGKLEVEGPLKLEHVVFQVPLERGALHELGCVHSPDPLNVHRPPIEVDPMVALRVILPDFIQLGEHEILLNCVRTILFAPLEHSNPHKLRSLDIVFPRFQEPTKFFGKKKDQYISKRRRKRIHEEGFHATWAVRAC